MLMSPTTCLLKSAQGVCAGKFRNAGFLQANKTAWTSLDFESFEVKPVETKWGN